MSGAPTPQVLLEAIASSASVGTLPGNKTAPMPETQPGTPNAASIQTGFNANTMTNENAGGRPPLGPDINGMWFLVSSHTLYVECGQTYKYNSDLASSISGYLAGTILGMTDNSGLWLNTSDGNTTDPDAGGANWVPLATYGFANVTGLTGVTRTLSAAESKFSVIVLNGVLTTNQTVIFPQTKQQWLVINRTSGAFTTTAKTASVGFTGLTIPQGGYSSPLGVYSIGDGNLYPTIAPLSVPIDQNATALTLVERTNNGYVLATYFNQSSALENPTVGAVYTQSTTPGDTYLRKISLTNFEAQLLLQSLGGQLVNGQVPFSVISQWASALFANTALTGVPTAPTAGAGTSNAQLATTQFANPTVTVGGSGVAIPLPNGYIFQIGVCNPNGGTLAVTLPRSFPTAALAVFAGGPSHPTQHNASIVDPGHISVTNTGGISYYLAFGN